MQFYANKVMKKRCVSELRMLPRLFFKIIKYLEEGKGKLIKAAVISMGSLVLLLFVNWMAGYFLAILFVPLCILLLILGLFVVSIWFEGAAQYERFDDWWVGVRWYKKIAFYICLLYISFWFLGVMLMSVFAIIHTLLFLYNV